MYRNRAEAARLLAERLGTYKGQNPLVLAIPRGAVPMGWIIAESLNGELDVVLVHKLGAPGNPELAVGAVSEDGDIFLGEAARELSVSGDYIEREAEEQLGVLNERRSAYTPGRGPIAPSGRTVILVDDGVATGSTMEAAVYLVRETQPERLVVAVGVAPPKTLNRLRTLADEVVCPEVPDVFHAVGQAFAEFEPVTDADVVRILRAATKDA